MMLKIFNRDLHKVDAFAQIPNAEIAVAAEKGSNFPCRVAVVDMKSFALCGGAPTNRALAVLLFPKFGIRTVRYLVGVLEFNVNHLGAVSGAPRLGASFTYFASSPKLGKGFVEQVKALFLLAMLAPFHAFGRFMAGRFEGKPPLSKALTDLAVRVNPVLLIAILVEFRKWFGGFANSAKSFAHCLRDPRDFPLGNIQNNRELARSFQ